MKRHKYTIIAVCVFLVVATSIFLVSSNRAQTTDQHYKSEISRNVSEHTNKSDLSTKKLGSSEGAVGFAGLAEPNKNTIAISMLLTFALMLVLYARHRRLRVLLASPHLVTPSDFSNFITALDSRAKGFEVAIGQLVHGNELTKKEYSINFEEMRRTFLTLQEAIAQRDEQIKRLEDGLETNLGRKFMKRFVRVDQFVNKKMELEPGDSLAQVQAVLRDALEESDVTIYEPELGSDYRKDNFVADRPEICGTTDELLYYKIKSVRAPGYLLKREIGEYVVIMKAQVEVYGPSGEQK